MTGVEGREDLPGCRALPPVPEGDLLVLRAGERVTGTGRRDERFEPRVLAVEPEATDDARDLGLRPGERGAVALSAAIGSTLSEAEAGAVCSGLGNRTRHLRHILDHANHVSKIKRACHGLEGTDSLEY